MILLEDWSRKLERKKIKKEIKKEIKKRAVIKVQCTWVAYIYPFFQFFLIFFSFFFKKKTKYKVSVSNAGSYIPPFFGLHSHLTISFLALSKPNYLVYTFADYFLSHSCESKKEREGRRKSRCFILKHHKVISSLCGGHTT